MLGLKLVHVSKRCHWSISNRSCYDNNPGYIQIVSPSSPYQTLMASSGSKSSGILLLTNRSFMLLTKRTSWNNTLVNGEQYSKKRFPSWSSTHISSLQSGPGREPYMRTTVIFIMFCRNITGMRMKIMFIIFQRHSIVMNTSIILLTTCRAWRQRKHWLWDS